MAQLEDRLRDHLVARGFMESRTVPFAPDRDGDVALLLPLSAEESRLRRELLPSLLRRVEHNWARGADDVRLFEIGTGFGAAATTGELPAETRRVALALGGRRAPAHWTGGADAFDVWDLKGVLEELVGMAVAPGARVRPARAAHPLFMAEQFELVDASDTIVGHGGRVRPDALDTPARIATPMWAAELRITLAGVGDGSPTYTPIPAHPAIERDLALLEQGGTSASTIEATIRAAAGELLEDVRPFDVFRGGTLPAAARSIAFRLRFRAAGRTLTDEEVDRSVQKVLRALKEEHGIERR